MPRGTRLSAIVLPGEGCEIEFSRVECLYVFVLNGGQAGHLAKTLT